MSRKSPVIQEGMEVALQEAGASKNNCTLGLRYVERFSFSDYKSNQIKSTLHFYSTFDTTHPKALHTETKAAQVLMNMAGQTSVS